MQARDYAYDGLRQTGCLISSYPWQAAAIEEITQLMGEDYWPYGIEKNRHVLASVTQFSHEPGLIPRRLQVEELFPSSVMDEFKV